ncbi:MAG: roadblock/LC7 domain-containing protein [Promethearchaeota archaeon]|jgi:predicted regulator of Ras-like GTPase activity (Roadblock/LC7/MglB family)
MNNHIPKVLYKNKITEVLDEIRYNYGKLTRKGYIYGLIAIDQDAKIIAIDSRFDRDLNYWDLSSIGAALYGVARQGQDFFESKSLERATIIYDDMRLFVKSIGKVELQEKGKRDVLVVLLTDNDVNLGVIFLQLSNFALKIKKQIEEDRLAQRTMKMSENEIKEHIKELKKEIFSDRLGTIS